jgi:hypothetical protein
MLASQSSTCQIGVRRDKLCRWHRLTVKRGGWRLAVRPSSAMLGTSNNNRICPRSPRRRSPKTRRLQGDARTPCGPKKSKKKGDD